MTFIFGAVLILLGSPKAGAALNETNANVREQYNEAAERIYSRLLRLKGQYPELQDFSREAMSRDRNDFDTISYVYDLQGDHGYQFFMNVQDVSADAFDEAYDSWRLKFPILGFEVAVESKRPGESAAFDPRKIIEENFQDLKVLEQGYLPFRLELKADKDVYKVREQITLNVSLKNMGSLAFKVADLNEQSLYCKIDDMEWGSKESTGEIDSVLKPYGSLRKILKVQGIDAPKEAWIACTYGLGFKGVQPYNRIKVLIKPGP